MSRQEEIREGIAETIRQVYIDGYNARCNGEVWEQEDGSVNLPEQGILIKTLQLEQWLDSQGVVIVAERELPSIFDIDEDVISALEYKKMLAGFVAFEPLIKEVK